MEKTHWDAGKYMHVHIFMYRDANVISKPNFSQQ